MPDVDMDAVEQRWTQLRAECPACFDGQICMCSVSIATGMAVPQSISSNVRIGFMRCRMKGSTAVSAHSASRRSRHAASVYCWAVVPTGSIGTRGSGSSRRGGVEPGCSPEDVLLRELDEEAGCSPAGPAGGGGGGAGRGGEDLGGGLSTRGSDRGADSIDGRIQRTSLVFDRGVACPTFAHHRMHAWPACRMSRMTAAADAPEASQG